MKPYRPIHRPSKATWWVKYTWVVSLCICIVYTRYTFGEIFCFCFFLFNIQTMLTSITSDEMVSYSFPLTMYLFFKIQLSSLYFLRFIFSTSVTYYIYLRAFPVCLHRIRLLRSLERLADLFLNTQILFTPF